MGKKPRNYTRMIRRLRLLLRPRTVLLVAVVLAGLFVIGRGLYMLVGQPRPAQQLVLLIGDGIDPASPQVELWRDAANETGLPMQVENASRFLRPRLWPTTPAGIVLPDALLRRASRSLTGRLEQYVANGGTLMVVFDAATQMPGGGDASDHRALLSGLVGVDYALYRKLRRASIGREAVHGDAAVLRQLHIPPGKFMPAEGDATLYAYQYGAVSYPQFVTNGVYPGQVLLRGRDGNLVAGLHRVGRGQVLFVNLPLGYLKLRTDGMLLHGFLAWFGEHVAGLPRLLSVPRGVGGLVLNLHIDSNAALAPLAQLRKSSRLFEQGPYSVHFTAGPDTYREGDHAGLDLQHNPDSQAWVRLFAARGDSIGSHGGWAHNLFANRIDAHNGATYAPWIARNNEALAGLTGQPVREYSSPVGHHPQWITDWLGQHGILGYYFTGDAGMAPTRSYRDGRRSDANTWAFPLVSYGRVASFEEAGNAGIDNTAMGHWFTDLAGFVAIDRSVRLFYFHPPGALNYLAALDTLLETVHARGSAFRWYTIADLARFLDRREHTRWSMDEEADGWLLQARNPLGLDNLAWFIPAASYDAVSVVSGPVQVFPVEGGWLAWVEHGQQFSVHVHARVQRRAGLPR